MSEISISDARADLSATFKRAKKKPVHVTSHGKTQAVIVDPSLYEKMIEALEELEDIKAFDKAMADKTPGIPWELVKKDLGLV